MFWWLWRREKRLMIAIAQGATLKSHRHIDGEKVYYLWPLENEGETAVPQEIGYRVVQRLLAWKLITTNQKFPAATFLLTSKGQKRVRHWQGGLRGVGAVVHFDS